MKRIALQCAIPMRGRAVKHSPLAWVRSPSRRIEGGRRFAGLLLVFAGLWLPGSVARAGFISMDTRVEVEFRDGQLVLRVSTTNRGDEPAFQVRLEALHPESPKSSPTFEKLEVGGSAEHTFQWELPATGTRQRVIPVLTHYADANYYPLSSLSQVVVPFGGPPVTTISARADPIEADPLGVLRVHLRSLDDASHRVGLQVVTPAELGVRPRSAEVDVPASGEVQAEFELENFSGLPGSTYGVTAILREERPDGIVESMVSRTVKLVESTPPPTARGWIVAVVAAAGLVFTGWQLGAFRRLRRG